MKLTKTIMSVLLLGGVALSASGSIKVHDRSGQTKTYGDDVTKIVFDDSGMFDVTGSDPSREETKQIVVNRNCTLNLKNVNLKNTQIGVSSIEVNNGATLVLNVDGKNIVSSGNGAAGILVTENATLIVNRADNAAAADAVLYVSCGWNGAAIGGAGPVGSVQRSVNGGTIIVNSGTIVTRRSDVGRTYWCDGLGAAHTTGCKKVEINGGTIDLQTPGGICANSVVVISGGSVSLYNISCFVMGLRRDVSPVNKDNGVLTLAKIPVDTGILGDRRFLVEFLSGGYGTKDIFPIEDPESHRKWLYLYLPQRNHAVRVSGDNGSVDYTIGWNGSGFTVKSRITTGASVLVDGVLTDGERPVTNANATATVTVGGEPHDLAFMTDERGVFAVVLPAAAASSSAVLDNVTVGGKTTGFTATLNVPRLPYALGADAAELVKADSDLTVVDTQVTVQNELTMFQGATVKNDKLIGGVKGGITVGQPSPASGYALSLDGARNVGNTALHWIGEPITLVDAHARGRFEAESKQQFDGESSIYLYLNATNTDPIVMKEDHGNKGWYQFNLQDVRGFASVKLIKGGKWCQEPSQMYEISPYDYKAESDGFVVVEISMPENTLGGVAVTMDFNEDYAKGWQIPFDKGWHRGPWPSLPDAIPAFHRVYTYPMRKGGRMHLRVMWECMAAGMGYWWENYVFNKNNNTKTGYSDINVNVKVTFYPIGGYGKKEVAK